VLFQSLEELGTFVLLCTFLLSLESSAIAANQLGGCQPTPATALRKPASSFSFDVAAMTRYAQSKKSLFFNHPKSGS
jgi:hypothetical protein